MNTLFEIKFDDKSFTNCIDLFVRREKNLHKINNHHVMCNKYSFNTWMNCFAGKKYSNYCDLTEIDLKLSFTGTACIEVFGTNRTTLYGLEEVKLHENTYSGGALIQIKDFSKFEGIYFNVYESETEPANLINGEWCSPDTPNRTNKLAVVICTYKREKYVRDIISTFSQYINNTITDAKERLELIIVDNSSSLKIENKENVTIYHNKNFGGAGGFGRGLYEILNSHTDITRVIFMDDDVKICPESFYKTLSLADYLKDIYKNSFINGAMLDLFHPNIFFENLAVQNGFWVNPFIRDLDVNCYENVLKTLDIPAELFTQPQKRVGSGWYYHCFSTEIAKANGLPLPIFIRGDDVEWSWRSYGKHHISMNGISVWHSPFVWRVSPVTDFYYMTRNMFFINSKYNDRFEEQFINYFKQTFHYLIDTYDYVSIELMFKAFDDILSGVKSLEQNAEKQFLEANLINKKRVIVGTDPHEIQRVLAKQPTIKKSRKLLYKLSKKGLLAPKFVYRKYGLAPDFFPSVNFFALRKTVKVINPLTQKAELRTYSSHKRRTYEQKFSEYCTALQKNYSTIKEEFIANHSKITSREFWKRYLGLVHD